MPSLQVTPRAWLAVVCYNMTVNKNSTARMGSTLTTKQPTGARGGNVYSPHAKRRFTGFRHAPTKCTLKKQYPPSIKL